MGKKYSKVDPEKVIKRLKLKPSWPRELEVGFGYKHSTLIYFLRHSSFAKAHIIIQLEDGRYAVKDGVEEPISEEKEVQASYELLKRKFLRPPTPEELSSYVKHTPSKTRALLFKYIPGYREPTEEEVEHAAKALWKLLVHGLDLPGKKAWFEEGIIEVFIEGVDKEMLNRALKCSRSADLDRARKYLEEFSGLKPEITEEKRDSKITYKVNWGDEVKKILYPIDLWRQASYNLIPIKYDNDNEDPFGVDEYPYGSFEVSEELAENYVLSPRIMAYFLRFVGLPHHELRVLGTLKRYCKNAIEVGYLDRETKEMIALKLKDVAFVRDYERLHRNYEKANDALRERNDAFDIIEFLDLRNSEVINIARTYIDEIGNEWQVEQPIQGPNIQKVAIWLAKDPKLKTEIVSVINEKLQEACGQGLSKFLASLLVNIR